MPPIARRFVDVLKCETEDEVDVAGRMCLCAASGRNDCCDRSVCVRRGSAWSGREVAMEDGGE